MFLSVPVCLALRFFRARFGAEFILCAVSRGAYFVRGFARNVGSAWVGSSGQGCFG
ncbi:hypothetical protein XMV201_000183 [Aliiroseovarius sp. xm-v-201]|nr:hypothetical protein [Aliiroseovarius sp. xm-m-314]NRP44187.1 hypothetical protein [Aliiroseovarius sp. xm-m-378]NRP48438.1 hypothetical protein [Aliiroseovarius sp. xm-m-354]NRP65058.1 hypothetical protein [Aliiroseovarius sp. xm-v-225]NRP79090.1 hypothetical protein [Aliiroseovarius sp. xm-v-209]NRP91776.1 hypothetical protein [Aliiroseovarius sp. xm-a-134]NRQ03191.1 hypothetical protein [Aliiroseovarius sp. xm-m-309]NRQ06397.1 hypothetical protein [Aliiroseovarius sp. xm-v-201]NRQ1021